MFQDQRSMSLQDSKNLGRVFEAYILSTWSYLNLWFIGSEFEQFKFLSLESRGWLILLQTSCPDHIFFQLSYLVYT